MAKQNISKQLHLKFKKSSAKMSKYFKKTSKKIIKRKKTAIRKTKQLHKQNIRRVKKSYNSLKPYQQKNLICISIILVILTGLGINYWYKNRPAPEIVYSTILPESTSLETRILVAGDVYWGRRMNDWSQQSSLKEAYPFSRLNEFNRDQYDAWIANLECPAVPGIKQPIGFVPELWEFNCDTDYLPEAAKWFDVFSLANNHTQNQKREEGLEITRKMLDENGIQHFGNFNPHIKKDVCEVVSISARANYNGTQQKVNIPIALCGYDGVYYTITKESMAVMTKYSKLMPVIAFPHMGQEYQALTDDLRRDLYHQLVDNGADVVLGNHPHWVQPTEAYKGKLITYSLGNFIFDQQFSEEVMRSAAIDIVMSVDKENISTDQIKAWAQIGDNCSSFQDDCLEQAQNMKLGRLPFSLRFNIVAVDLSNKISKPANLKSYNAILDRLDWENTAKELR